MRNINDADGAITEIDIVGMSGGLRRRLVRTDEMQRIKKKYIGGETRKENSAARHMGERPA